MYNTFTQQENQPLFAFRHGEEARNEGDLNYSTHDESEDSLSDDVYTDSDTDFGKHIFIRRSHRCHVGSGI